MTTYTYRFDYGRGLKKTASIQASTIRMAIAMFLVYGRHDMRTLEDDPNPVMFRVTVKKGVAPPSVYYVECKTSGRGYPRIEGYFYSKVLKNGELGKPRWISR